MSAESDSMSQIFIELKSDSSIEINYKQFNVNAYASWRTMAGSRTQTLGEIFDKVKRLQDDEMRRLGLG